MCGIIGVYKGLEPEVAGRMLNRIVHRGPDEEGSIEVGGNWLGHRRLSIVDVNGGRQPLVTDSKSGGKLYLIGNGEIYNHQEVREKLPEVEYKTNSDNEVALHVVDQWGPERISELHGMFAFIVAGEDGRFVAARDPVGIKPLYWSERDGQIVFASELRTLLDTRRRSQAFRLRRTARHGGFGAIRRPLRAGSPDPGRNPDESARGAYRDRRRPDDG
jgi:asparagine synthase (glutamine-hydrolysing)